MLKIHVRIAVVIDNLHQVYQEKKNEMCPLGGPKLQIWRWANVVIAGHLWAIVILWLDCASLYNEDIFVVLVAKNKYYTSVVDYVLLKSNAIITPFTFRKELSFFYELVK